MTRTGYDQPLLNQGTCEPPRHGPALGKYPQAARLREQVLHLTLHWASTLRLGKYSQAARLREQVLHLTLHWASTLRLGKYSQAARLREQILHLTLHHRTHFASRFANAAVRELI